MGAERDSKGRFLVGNLTGKTNLGVKHTDSKVYRDMIDQCLSNYDGDYLYQLLEQVTDPERKLVYLIKMLDSNTKHIEAKNKLELEKLKVELQYKIGEDLDSNIIDVSYTENTDDDE
jgi:hypothetical protein